MKIIRMVSAILLALPLIIFGSNYFLQFFSLPTEDITIGAELLQMMRDGGLMGFIAFSHVLVGLLLLIPRARTFGALMQLPISIGIVCFHASMQPEGLLVAIIMLALTIGAMNLKQVMALCSSDS